MPALVLPVNKLGGSHGQGLRAKVLNRGGKVKGKPVEGEVYLPIVMLIQLVRMVLKRTKHSRGKAQGHADGEWQVSNRLRRQKKVVGADIREAADAEPDRAATLAQFLHGVISLSRCHLCPFR
jgi:hypothetical protein